MLASESKTKLAARESAALILLFFCAAWLSIEFTREFSRIAVVWVANGLLLAFLLTTPRTSWMNLTVGCFIANVLANLATGDGLSKAAALSLCNMIEVYFIATAIGGQSRNIQTVSWDYAAKFLLIGVILGPALAAFLASLALASLSHADPLRVFGTWYLADALGIALVTPLVLTFRRTEVDTPSGTKSKCHLAACLALTAGATAAVFGQTHYPLIFVIMPFLVLTAFHFGMFGLSCALITCAAIALILTALDLGPMALIVNGSIEERLRLVQIFVLFAELSTVPLALAIESRRRLEAQLATANEKLKFLANTDVLTGLPNRRAFDRAFQREWLTAQRERSSLAIAFIDVDYFKAFNDANGHRAGDDCLSRIGVLLAETVFRPRDFVGRYGGEEFVLIMPSTDAAGAINVCDRLRCIVFASGLPHDKSPFEVLTVSIGVAVVTPDRSSDGDYFLDEADRALYAAKSSGRNRVECADTSLYAT